MTKSGFVTIIGRPNAGKSTLMNTLIGQKIAITSYKPQTTRNQIRTIYTDERGQIVFLDTPGLHEMKDRLGRYMVKAASSTLDEVDVILWLVEPKAVISEDDRAILELVSKAKRKEKVILVITKCDTVSKEAVLPVISLYSAEWKKEAGCDFAAVIPVSSRKREGTDDLMETIFSLLPEGEPFYDADEVTTQTQRQIASEIIREKALRLLQEEVPHGIAVTISKMHTRKGKNGPVCDVEADIICERESHKGIIIGKNGEMLKKIGTAARKDIEEMLECHVNLKLFVKVRKDWKDDEAALKSFGYNVKDLEKHG